MLKKKYMEISKKYKLPSFSEMDSDFEIYKIDRESDFLLRTIRKQMMEKVVNSMSFVEMFLTGNNAPRMYFNYLKNLSNDDKKKLDAIYNSLSNLVISSLELEIDSDDKREAELVNQIFKTWNSVKGNFKLVLKNVKNPVVSNVKKERSYFG